MHQHFILTAVNGYTLRTYYTNNGQIDVVLMHSKQDFLYTALNLQISITNFIQILQKYTWCIIFYITVVHFYPMHSSYTFESIYKYVHSQEIKPMTFALPAHALPIELYRNFMLNLQLKKHNQAVFLHACSSSTVK